LEIEAVLNLSVIHEAKTASWVTTDSLTTERRPPGYLFFRLKQ
jgi:hypothetical protein